MMLWKMAWRNLWRNTRRTLLTMSAIGLGLSLLIILVSFMEGFKEMIVAQITQSGAGAIQIQHPDYLLKRQVHLVIENVDSIVKTVAQVQGVSHVNARLNFSGVIRSSRSNTVQIVQMIAVSPEREKAFSRMASKVKEGGFITPPDRIKNAETPARFQFQKGILIGRKLSKLLNVSLGSKIRLDTAGFGNSITASAFYVTGIFEAGADSFDRSTVYVNIEDMQEATGTQNIAHEIAIMVSDQQNISSIAEQIKHVLATTHKESAHLSVLTWWEMFPDFKKLVDISDGWIWLMYVLMLVILSAGILTTMFMLVFERKREFSIQLALGTNPSYLFACIMSEVFFLALVSLCIGIIFGGIGVFLLVRYGIDLRWILGGYDLGGLFIENIYRGSTRLEIFLKPSVIVFFSTLLFALWPAIKVARMFGRNF